MAATEKLIALAIQEICTRRDSIFYSIFISELWKLFQFWTQLLFKTSKWHNILFHRQIVWYATNTHPIPETADCVASLIQHGKNLKDAEASCCGEIS